MDDTDKTKPLVPVVGLSKKAIAKLTSDELITTAALYGCSLYRGSDGTNGLFYCGHPSDSYEMAFGSYSMACLYWLSKHSVTP